MDFAGTHSSATAVNSTFTAPSIVLANDLAPSQNAKQYYVSTITGTGKSTEDVHSADKPFTVTIFKPLTYKRQGPVNPSTGVSTLNPVNEYRLIIRKGVDTTGGVPGVAIARLSISIPAGAETGDPLNLDMVMSMLSGLIFDKATDFATALRTGVI